MDDEALLNLIKAHLGDDVSIEFQKQGSPYYKMRLSKAFSAMPCMAMAELKRALVKPDAPKPRCPHCFCNNTRFRYFNNRHSASPVLQLRYTCLSCNRNDFTLGGEQYSKCTRRRSSMADNKLIAGSSNKSDHPYHMQNYNNGYVLSISAPVSGYDACGYSSSVPSVSSNFLCGPQQDLQYSSWMIQDQFEESVAASASAAYLLEATCNNTSASGGQLACVDFMNNWEDLPGSSWIQQEPIIAVGAASLCESSSSESTTEQQNVHVDYNYEDLQFSELEALLFDHDYSNDCSLNLFTSLDGLQFH